MNEDIVTGRRIGLYFAWSRPEETAAPLGVLENRFPALFELRRFRWPRLEQFADPDRFDQGIAGFLDHVQLPNFALFCDLASAWTGNPVQRVERQAQNGFCPIDARLLEKIDTLIVISFDSLPATQRPKQDEVSAIRAFLQNPDHTLFVCPHHDIGDVALLPAEERRPRQEEEFRHHGDPTIPATQRFGGFATALLEELDMPVKNRFGLRPAVSADGSPVPLDIAGELDRFSLLKGVTTFNAHPHLPHLERLGAAVDKFDVLARQRIDLDAPPHPFVADGHQAFDALLQSRSEIFPGRLLVCDATMWSSTVGGLDSLRNLWLNVASLARATN